MRKTLMVVLLLTLAGCTGAEIAVIGAATGGVKTGQEITRTGKLKVAVMDTGDRCFAAAERACEQLGLKVYDSEKSSEFRWVLHVAERKHTMKITVSERAPRLSQIEVNVGIFGSSSIAELVVKRIVAELGDGDGGGEAR